MSQLDDSTSDRVVVIWTTTPWTTAGQSRDLVIRSRSPTASIASPQAPADNWAKTGATLHPRRQARAEMCSRRRKGRRASSACATSPRRSAPTLACAHPLARIAATISTCRCSTAITSPTTPAPASSTPRPATAARTSTSGWRTAAMLAARGIDTRIPYTVDADGFYTKEAPGFEGKRVIDDKGKKGDANEAVIEALRRSRQPHRARAAEASVSAFLALEEAGDLPQHAAMVHRDGQGIADHPPLAGRVARRRGRWGCTRVCSRTLHPPLRTLRRRGAGERADAARSRARRKSPTRDGCRRRARTASPA